MRPLEIIPPVYFYLCIVVMGVVHFTLPGAVILEFPWKLSGIVPLVAGMALNLIADTAFKQRGTTVLPLGKTTALITDGVFRISRHPMYLGFLLVLIGVAMLLGSLTPFAFVVAFAVFIDAVFIRFEESKMEAQFGEAWREYKRRVRRWV